MGETGGEHRKLVHAVLSVFLRNSGSKPCHRGRAGPTGGRYGEGDSPVLGGQRSAGAACHEGRTGGGVCPEAGRAV